MLTRTGLNERSEHCDDGLLGGVGYLVNKYICIDLQEMTNRRFNGGNKQPQPK